MATPRQNSPRKRSSSKKTTASKSSSTSRRKPGTSTSKRRNRSKQAPQEPIRLNIGLPLVIIISLCSSSAIGYIWFFAPWPKEEAQTAQVEPIKKLKPAPPRPAPQPQVDVPPPPPKPWPDENRMTEEEVAIINEIAGKKPDETKPPEPEEKAEPQEPTVIGPEGEFIGEEETLIAKADPPATAKPKEEAKPEPEPEPVVKAATPANVARAQPLNPDEMTTERVAAYQVALERMHFSCGFVDGDVGMRTRRVIRAFQQSRGLPVTGELDAATRNAIGEPGEPFTNYIVTAKDMEQVVPTPKLWKEKSKAKFLGYNDPWEMLAEKFHCTVGYLKDLNPDVTTVGVGTEVIGPKVFPAQPIRKADSIRIILDETTIQALDANGRIMAHFPCSIARNKNKRPQGELRVKNIAVNPDYTFSPDVITSVAEAEGITKKMILPPGPNNPVGTAWVGLTLPGYGMHGTPEPEDISRTQSSGCFRLSNWNANKLLRMVKVGMPVNVIPPKNPTPPAAQRAERAIPIMPR